MLKNKRFVAHMAALAIMKANPVVFEERHDSAQPATLVVELRAACRDSLTRFFHGNIARHMGRCTARTRPVNGVADRALNFRLMVNRIQLVAGTEIKNSSCTSRPAAAAAQHVTAFEPGDEYQLFRLRDRERLAVHFALRNLDELAKALCDFMRGVHDPETFAFTGFAPTKGARCAHERFENLRVVTGVENDQSHSGVQ